MWGDSIWLTLLATPSLECRVSMRVSQFQRCMEFFRRKPSTSLWQDEIFIPNHFDQSLLSRVSSPNSRHRLWMTLFFHRDLPCSVASPSWNLAGMRRRGCGWLWSCSWCCCSSSWYLSPLLLPLVPLLLPPAPAPLLLLMLLLPLPPALLPPSPADNVSCLCLLPLPPAAVSHSALVVLQLGSDVVQNVVCNTKSILFGTVITIPCKTMRKKKQR